MRHYTSLYIAWNNSLRTSSELNMPYAEGHSEYEIGRHLQINDPSRVLRLKCAREIFNRLDAYVPFQHRALQYKAR